MITFITKYYSGDQIENKKLGRACRTYGESKGACRVLVGKSEGKMSL